MNKTDIEWCDVSWNPVTGCLHDCEYCYAHDIAWRFRGFEPRCGGEFIPCRKTNSISETTRGELLHVFNEQPMKRTKSGFWQKASYPYEFEPTFHKYRLDEPQKTKKARSIFVCSMADLFGDWVPDEWIEEVFDVCYAAPQHTYLFLTKNPNRYAKLSLQGILPKNDNYWYGSTTTTQGAPYWLNPQYRTFRSIEPLIGEFDRYTIPLKYADCVIIGAETGNHKSKVIPRREWIEAIVEVCRATNTPVFMKNSLVPIVGEESMRRDLPWEVHKK